MKELAEQLNNQEQQIKELNQQVNDVKSDIYVLGIEVNTKVGSTEFNKIQEKAKSLAGELAKNEIVLGDTKIEIQKETISINSPKVVIECQ